MYTPFQRHDVEVNVEVEQTTEPLDERDRAPAPAPDARHPALPGGERSQEDPQHLPAQSATTREQEAHPEGKREDPLPGRHVREHPIDQVRCGFVHSPGAARGADASAFARESHQQLVPALAADAGEAAGEDPTVEVTRELALDVSGQTCPVRTSLAGFGEECGQVLLDDLVEDRVLRLAPLVAGGSQPSVLGRSPWLLRRLRRCASFAVAAGHAEVPHHEPGHTSTAAAPRRMQAGTEPNGGA